MSLADLPDDVLATILEYYFVKPRVTGMNNLKMAADAGHCEGMYLYGMALINEKQLTEGSYYIEKLWTERGDEHKGIPWL
ncbi:hypothetical protein Bca52824_027530 [Brassica carinata]|uniref:At2g35280-like TPR domain-containing protein n=1 Tax=Brassica carinata TaxID=52824 RepID=A0A8X8AQD5_BRACI|nr:hypothetical protein Bca52824_027530 [Brassica carinata]